MRLLVDLRNNQVTSLGARFNWATGEGKHLGPITSALIQHNTSLIDGMNGIGLYVVEESPNKRSVAAYLPTHGSGIKEHEWCIDWHDAGPID